MSVLLLRQMLMGLLSLLLVMPAAGLHVCRCSRGETVVVSSSSDAATTLRPCCAKRLAAARAAQPTSPSIEAKCCCSELRWNQAVSQISPSRSTVKSCTSLDTDWMPLVVMDLTPSRVAVESRKTTTSRLPNDPLRIMLCRWQV